MHKQSILIDNEQLKALGAEAVVFDCRFSLASFAEGPAAFDEGHICGAEHLNMETDLSGPKTPGAGRHPLPEKAALQARLRAAGVNDDSHIVLYDSNRFAGAARAWWLLTYFGFKQVHILDGGLPAWEAAGEALDDTSSPTRPEGNVTLNEGNADMRVLMTDVQAGLDASKTLVDARELERFQGLAEPIDPVAGRIPGAVNLPWQGIADAQGLALSGAQLAARWDALQLAGTPVHYCGSGVTAAVNALSLALAGRDIGQMYCGSFSEWCAQESNTVEHDRRE
ncbi:MAG: sulfurtransferase [Pseudomonadota bacterium]